MIELPRHVPPPSADFRIRVLGLGGAGSNLLDRIQIDGAPGLELVAINTDVQKLTASVAPQKVQLGPTLTRGLGAGGDPELGYRAAEESAGELRAALEGAQMVFVCVGLGGGTGSGAVALAAAYARETGALVIVFATLPFTFEGRRRMLQAEECLATLGNYADAIICFENDKMGEYVTPNASVNEAFEVTDRIFSQSVRAIAALVRRRGLIHGGADDLRTALPARNARCLFGFGEAEGDNRAYSALERALKSPLMDRGRMLAEVENVLIHVAGDQSLTLNEIQLLMEEFNRHIHDSTRILFSTAVDPWLGNRLTVTLLSSREAAGNARNEVRAPAALPQPAAPPVVPIAEPVAVVAAAQRESLLLAESRREELPERSVRKAEPQAEPAQFDSAARGRFEKSEPTIVDGQDLDVPTFLRRNIKPR